MTNFVDLPGLIDTEGPEGCDQAILDKMDEEIKAKCLRIDMFILCIEQSKFDSGMDKIIKIY